MAKYIASDVPVGVFQVSAYAGGNTVKLTDGMREYLRRDLRREELFPLRTGLAVFFDGIRLVPVSAMN